MGARWQGIVNMRLSIFYWSLLTTIVAALSLGPSFAHVLEAAPRLSVWSRELWRETTVFNAQFWLFAAVGAPLDLAAIALPAILAVMLRKERPAFRFALATAVLTHWRLWRGSRWLRRQMPYWPPGSLVPLPRISMAYVCAGKSGI